MIIREAASMEAPAIAQAHAEAHWETYLPLLGAATRRLEPGPLELAWRRAFLTGAIVRVAEHNDAIVGLGQIAGETLSDLYLRALWRRQGLGSRLLVELLAEAGSRGVETVRFNVHSANAPAIAFYATFGAREVGRQLMRHPGGDWEDFVFEMPTAL
jgi:ribosomal protein S18 acetylase RimI-like enzyme